MQDRQQGLRGVEAEVTKGALPRGLPYMWGFVIRAPCHFSTARKVLLTRLLLGIQTEQTMGASVMVLPSAVMLVQGLPFGGGPPYT